MARFGEDLDPSLEYLPICLEHIHQFYSMIQATMQSHPESDILLCTGPSPYTQFGTLFLLGCHFILSGLDLQETVTLLMDFEYVITTFKCQGLTAPIFWGSLHCIKRMGWINLEAEDEIGPISSHIDIEEYVHYSRQDSP